MHVPISDVFTTYGASAKPCVLSLYLIHVFDVDGGAKRKRLAHSLIGPNFCTPNLVIKTFTKHFFIQFWMIQNLAKIWENSCPTGTKG
jgi:hypothetical protein